MSITTASAALQDLHELAASGQAGVTAEQVEQLHAWAEQAYPEHTELVLVHELCHRYAGNAPAQGSPDFVPAGPMHDRERLVVDRLLMRALSVVHSPASEATPAPGERWSLANEVVINDHLAQRLGR